MRAHIIGSLGGRALRREQCDMMTEKSSTGR
jgi:hypothetical protein